MAKSKMLTGTPILVGDNTVPGMRIHSELKPLIPKIEEACRKMGLDYFPIVVEIVSYSDMSELASYGGFPNRYPHWKFGMEYEELSRGYEYGQHRISEMVINNDPCYIYCMDSNTLVDNVDVIAHAIGHNDFFKNNIFFQPTHRNMMNKMANHGSRIRKYMRKWGDEKVTEFIDDVLRIQTLIDPSNAWDTKKVKKVVIQDERKYRFPRRLEGEHNYMDPWLNTEEYLDKERKRVKRKDLEDQLDIFTGDERDVFAYLKDHAPMKPWQKDVISMLYEEAMYFAPQRQTKMINEGWASYVDFEIMCRQGLAALGQKSDDCGIIHYAHHKMLVLGSKYSQNPYKLGFELFMDIEDRWNKGKFGREWEECDDMRARKEWDKKLGLGKEKVFEVRKTHNDYTLIQEFFTPEFCESKEFYEYKRFPNGEWVIVNRDFKSIKKKLLQKYQNGGLPDIRLVDPNHRGKGWFLIQHVCDGRPIYDPYAKEVITSLWRLWGNVVVLATQTTDDQEYVYVCDGIDPKDNVHVMFREDYEEKYL